MKRWQVVRVVNLSRPGCLPLIDRVALVPTFWTERGARRFADDCQRTLPSLFPLDTHYHWEQIPKRKRAGSLAQVRAMGGIR